MFSANITNRDPAEILLKNTADREFPQFIFASAILMPPNFRLPVLDPYDYGRSYLLTPIVLLSNIIL